MFRLIAFDTATAFAMSFGIAKFALAQEEAKLVGEIVGRHGRSPNPAIVRAVKKWPPIYTLKQLQDFFGAMNFFVRIVVRSMLASLTPFAFC